MRTFVITITVVLGLTGLAGFMSNTLWYKMEWIRRPPPTTTSKAVEDPDIVPVDTVLEHLANQTARFIDARALGDYEEGHLYGSLHVPSTSIYESVEQNVLGVGVFEEDLVIVYCGGGDCEASHDVKDVLVNDFNFSNVEVFKAGWEAVESSEKFGDYIVTGSEP